jgi:hypothetical protein
MNIKSKMTKQPCAMISKLSNQVKHHAFSLTLRDNEGAYNISCEQFMIINMDVKWQDSSNRYKFNVL